MDDVTIRAQTEDDIDAVVGILWEVGAEGRWIGTEVPFDKVARADGMRARFQDPDTFAGFLAVVDDRIVGSIGLGLTPYGVVELGMAILDGYRGRGIGKRLLDAGVDWARSTNAHKIYLEVWPDNERAVALYKNAGFVEEGRLRNHYRRNSGELWTSVAMGLLL